MVVLSGWSRFGRDDPSRLKAGKILLSARYRLIPFFKPLILLSLPLICLYTQLYVIISMVFLLLYSNYIHYYVFGAYHQHYLKHQHKIFSISHYTKSKQSNSYV